jgi:ribonuclease HI
MSRHKNLITLDSLINKKIPRGVRCGGVLFEPGGKRILNYYWNPGKDANNKAEACALLKGLQLENQRQIQNLNVVGDSKTIIRMMIQGSEPRNMSLKRVIDRIRLSTRTLKTKFFHIPRCNNVEADKMAKLAIGKPPRTLGVEDEEGLAPLI